MKKPELMDKVRWYVGRADGFAVELTDMVRHPVFVGVHFGRIQAVVEALAARGELVFDGVSIARRVAA